MNNECTKFESAQLSCLKNRTFQIIHSKKRCGFWGEGLGGKTKIVGV